MTTKNEVKVAQQCSMTSTPAYVKPDGKTYHPVYEFEQACKRTSDDNKDKRQRKKARTDNNRVAGEILLERSRAGASQVASESPQLSQGFQSGTESESSVSIVSNYTPRTPGMRKKAMSTMLTGQLQEASDFLKSQVEYQKRQLDLILEDREERKEEREERKRMEEERRKADEDARRDLAERQQKVLMDLMVLQTESMERIATQQTETSKEFAKQQLEFAKQQAASTERLILALVAGINKKE
ncbi:MAG: hypothetical protein BYD32DRAFT_426191 [Podila humilis]|nr:MAG: hypothetical protein BYD32DRAFT_426191 [Podila humilis]